MHDDNERSYSPGITLRSLIALVFCMLIMGMWIQLAHVYLAVYNAMAEQPLAVPAVVIFLALILLVGLVATLTKYRLLTRAEMFCIVCAMLMSAPLMTQGMWHRFYGLISATPKTGNFAYIDALSDKLWPHGPNLLEGALAEDNREALTFIGRPAEWREVEYQEGRTATLPVLVNEERGQVSSLSLRVPLEQEGRRSLIPGEPHLISILAHPEDLAPESFYFCRIYADDEAAYTEVINAKEKAKVTFQHQQGFLRLGTYGTRLPTSAQEYMRLEYGLSGPGTLALHDPKLFSVAATEYVFTGRKLVTESEYGQIPEQERAGLIVKPDRMWSLAGLKFLVTGYIPLRDWRDPAIAWGGFVMLILMATLAIGVIVRRQWAENERYGFPLFQVPYALLGHEDTADRPFSAIWRNPYFYLGIALALFWGVMKGWNFYNSSVPSLEVSIPLRPYFASQSWGAMMDVNFGIMAIGFAVALFMELNVSLSLVLGFFAYRSLFFVGEVANTKVYSGWPFRYEQAIGAYIAYAALVVFFMRKYLWRVVRSAFTKADPASRGEALSYRVALLLLLACFLGALVWAWWLEVPGHVILIFFAFLVLIGFVAAKFRAESGTPFGYFTPYNAMLLLTALGGIAVFGTKAMMVCLIASGFITVSVFYLIPGAQLELLEFGRRYRVVPRHLIYTAVLAVLGGVFIGGWVLLSNAYALGGDNLKGQYPFDQDWFFGSFRAQLSAATSDHLRTLSGEEMVTAIQPERWGFAIGAIPTIIVTILRQLFSGFWFHPFGAVMASSHLMEGFWGSLLVGWLVRSVVLRLGGAATVRGKLLPFAGGFLIGAMLSILVWDTYAVYLTSIGVDRTYGGMP